MSIYKTKEQKEDAKAKELARRKTEDSELVEMVVRCFNTEAGKFVLNHLMNAVAFEDSPAVVSAKTGKVLMCNTQYNLGRQSVYREIRKLLKPNHSQLLKEVEFMQNK
jgi:hypothetical protein